MGLTRIGFGSQTLGEVILPPHLRASCPRCSRKMIVKTTKAKNRAFWSCAAYPQCNGSKSIDADKLREYCRTHSVPCPLAEPDPDDLLEEGIF